MPVWRQCQGARATPYRQNRYCASRFPWVGEAATASTPLFALLGAVVGAMIAATVAWLNGRRATRINERLA